VDAGAWFETWFDEDYLSLYAHRDQEEAEGAVDTALRAAPGLARGPVLDLACGTGRHLAALRRRNPEAFGLDLSPSLLAQAEEGLRPWLVRGDMRRLPVRPASLAGICLWFTPFGYFDDEGNRALMGGLSRCLRPGGVLWMDYLNPGLVRASMVESESLERNGLRAEIRRTVEGNRIVKRISIHRPGEIPREAMESVRIYEPAELRDLAGAFGLELRAQFGTYDGAPFGPSSPRWIGVFVRAR
jgi:SAM-dependent methyltransferase